MKTWKAYLVPHPPIIIPEIGQEQRKFSQATIDAMTKTAEEVDSFDPEVVIIISPHGVMFKDAVSMWLEPTMRGDFSQFGHPELEMQVPVDTDLGEKVVKKMKEKDMPLAVLTKENLPEHWDQSLDHGIMVPYYYFDKAGVDAKMLAFTYGLLDRHTLYDFGRALQEVMEEEDKRYVIVASGDLSHCLKDDGPYEYRPEGETFDKELLRIIIDDGLEGILDMDEKLIERAGQCGYRSLVILAGILHRRPRVSKFMSYEGPYGVGYAVFRWETINENPYINLARSSIEHYLETGRALTLEEEKKAGFDRDYNGIFVTLYKDGNLRGCIGSVGDVEHDIADEIIHQAINASQMDPRFPPVTEEELDDIVISVDVLDEPERIRTLKNLDPEVYGIIVTKGMRRGLLLPRIDGVDTVEEQLSIALRKAGIRENEDYEIERFKVTRFE